MPDEPEARGLLALMLFCEAHRPARRDAAGRFVPLSEQDVSPWSAPLLAEAQAAPAAASSMRRLGPFQLEAAIQAVHADRAYGRAVNWRALVRLYEGLIRIGATLGAIVGQAAALAEADGAAAGLARLAELPEAGAG